MHRLQQTQELEAVLSAHRGERFSTLVGVGTDLATARNGAARARHTVVHFFFIRTTNITVGPAGCHTPLSVALIITLFSVLQSKRLLVTSISCGVGPV